MVQQDISSEGIILVLGVTGAGKSYFLNQLKAGCAQEGHSLNSETKQCQAVQIFLDDEKERSVTVVDTPGFDDTKRPHGEVLAEITEFLAAQYEIGVPLRGVLYLHKITDNKMTGSAQTYLNLFESLVGEDAFPNVIFVTTMWNKLRDEHRARAMRHEQELMDHYWSRMVDKGSYVIQFNGSSDSAYALLWQVAENKNAVLRVQKQMFEEGLTVLETSAGSDLARQLVDDSRKYRNKADELSREISLRQTAPEPQDRDQIRRLLAEKTQVDRVLESIDQSIEDMKVCPAMSMRHRIREAMGRSGRGAIGSTATVLAAVLNVTISIVQLAVGM